MASTYRFRVGVRIYRGNNEMAIAYDAGQVISHEHCAGLLEAKEIRPDWVEPAEGAAPSLPPSDDEE